MFQNFLMGFQAGNTQRVERNRENALARIGASAAQGDFGGASSAAFRSGMLSEGVALNDYGQQQQRQQTTRNVGQQLATGNYTGAQSAAFGAGELDMGFNIQQIAQGLDDRGRARAAEGFQFFAQVAGTPALRQAPPEQRAAVARQLLEGSPFFSPEIGAMLDRLAADGISDQELDTIQMQMMDAGQQMAMTQAQQGIAIDNALGQAVIEGLDGAGLESRIAGMPGGGAMAYDMREGRQAAAAAQARAAASAASSGPYIVTLTPEQAQETLGLTVAAPIQYDTRSGRVTAVPGVGGVDANQRGRLMLSFDNLISAEQTLQSILGPDFSNNPFGNEWLARGADAIPWDGGATARALGSPEYDRFDQAARSFESAIMPIFSGSAVTESEASRFVRANQPLAGDGPEVARAKTTNRMSIINGAAQMLGVPPPFPDVPTWLPQGGGGGGLRPSGGMGDAFDVDNLSPEEIEALETFIRGGQ